MALHPATRYRSALWLPGGKLQLGVVAPSGGKLQLGVVAPLLLGYGCASSQGFAPAALVQAALPCRGLFDGSGALKVGFDVFRMRRGQVCMPTACGRASVQGRVYLHGRSSAPYLLRRGESLGIFSWGDYVLFKNYLDAQYFWGDWNWNPISDFYCHI